MSGLALQVQSPGPAGGIWEVAVERFLRQFGVCDGEAELPAVKWSLPVGHGAAEVERPTNGGLHELPFVPGQAGQDFPVLNESACELVEWLGERAGLAEWPVLHQRRLGVFEGTLRVVERGHGESRCYPSAGAYLRRSRPALKLGGEPSSNEHPGESEDTGQQRSVHEAAAYALPPVAARNGTVAEGADA